MRRWIARCFWRAILYPRRLCRKTLLDHLDHLDHLDQQTHPNLLQAALERLWVVLRVVLLLLAGLAGPLPVLGRARLQGLVLAVVTLVLSNLRGLRVVRLRERPFLVLVLVLVLILLLLPKRIVAY